MIKKMVMEFLNLKMEINIKECIKMIICKDLGNLSIIMENNILDNLVKELNKVKEN